MDKNKEDEIVGSLYGTEYFGSSGGSFGGGKPAGPSSDSGIVIKIVVILLAIIAFAAYSKAEDRRREKDYHEMWKNQYRGYSEEDWQRSRYNKDGSRKTNYNDSSGSTTSKKSTTYKTPAVKDQDSFNVKDYRDPEDFYYDHYDDFYDYEEAEDYYYENEGF